MHVRKIFKGDIDKTARNEITINKCNHDIALTKAHKLPDENLVLMM